MVRIANVHNFFSYIIFYFYFLNNNEGALGAEHVNLPLNHSMMNLEHLNE